MKKGRRFISVIMMLAMVVALAACGKSGDEKEGSGEETKVVRVNFTRASTDVEYEWYVEWLDSLKEATGGEFDYEMYASSGLGTDADVLEMAAQGQSVATSCDFAYLADYVPDMAAAMAPYVIEKPEQLAKLWQSELGQEWCEELAAQGLHILVLHYTGTRNLLTNKLVETRDDISKMTIRCAATPMWNEQVRVLGGNATNIPMSEMYQALSQGVADGCENTMGVIYSSKLYEPCKYILKTEHLVSANILVMSEDVYQSFSDEAKEIIDQSALQYAEEIIEKRNAAEAETEEQLKELGVEIKEADKEQFKKAAEGTPEEFPEWTPGITEDIKKAIEDEE